MRIQSREDRIYRFYLAAFTLSRSGVESASGFMMSDKAAEVEEYCALAIGAADGKDWTDTYGPVDKPKVIARVEAACAGP